MRISLFLQVLIGVQPLGSRQVQKRAFMPARNEKESELDSEDGTTTRWRGVKCWIERRFTTHGQLREFDRSLYRCHYGRRSIDIGRSNSRRINAAACNRSVRRLFMRTAVVVIRRLRDVTQAHQSGHPPEDNEDQRICNPEFGPAEHISF